MTPYEFVRSVWKHTNRPGTTEAFAPAAVHALQRAHPVLHVKLKQAIADRGLEDAAAVEPQSLVNYITRNWS